MSINSGYYITISRAKKDDANDNGIPDKVDIETVLGQIPNIDSSELVSEGKEYEIEVSVTVDSEKESISSENFVLRDKNATSAFFDQHGRPTTKPVSLVAGGKTKVYLNVFADDETVTGIYTITINRSDNETVKITEFEQIKLHGGTADNTVYEDVYAVTSHLNENYSSVVILNTNDIVPVTKWTSTDNYTPNIAGDYTFTAELGDLPVGYTLGEGVTATAVVTIYDKNQSAGVKDTVLQEKLCAILNVEKNHDITVGDMMELTGTLDLSKNYDDNSIGDYSGLCHAKNITELDLSSNDLSSLMSTDKLSDLTYLTELKVLNLNGSDLTSLPNMRNMTKLEKLSVGENPLTEVSQLKELTTLKSLVMNKCNLNSLPNLKGLVNLEYLNIGENKLTTLKDSGIEELSSLIEFNAENNKLTAIDLSKLKKLTDLNLRTNKFTSLTVKDLPELTDIYVCDNALNHIELKGLPRLSKLYMGSVFGGNELTAMPDISDLTGLTEVSIWKNKLTDITGDFSKLTKLTRIDASYNQLTSISASICSITSLNTLNLQNNKINSIDENISKLTNLNALLLNKNELSDLSGGVSGLTNMTILRLDNNKFEILPDSIGDLTNLTSLSLNNNNLKTLPVSLGNLTKVEHLDMSSNKLSKFPSFISKLTALKEIAIAFNSLTDVDTDSEGNKVDLSKLTNVTNVDLSYNHIDQLPNSLKTLPNLKTIKMYSNYIANIPKNYLKDMKSLDTFMISYNYIDWDNDPVSMKEIEDFWKSNDDPTWYYDAHGLYATLKSMDTSAGLIELEDKGSDKYSYNLKAPAGTTSITITPTGASSKTKISMGDNQINSGESFTVNNLKVGVNEITLVATNEIDNKTVTYKIILNIPKAGAEILDPDHLPDGTYGLDIDAMKENENAASMTNQFITEAAKIDVKDGKMTLTMVWNRTDTIPMTWLEGLWYRDKNGEFVDMITPDDDPKTYDKYTYSENVKYNEEKKSLTITLPVQSITKDQYLKVYVPKGMGESRPVLRIVFNTDTLIDLATGEEVDTIDLVSIALDTTNAKKEYTEDEPLDLSGLVVTGTYDNGSKKTLAIIEKNVTGFDSSMPVEKQTLTVTMNGISATYDISIKEEPFSEVVIDKDHIKQDQVITSERKKIVLNEISGELAKRASVKISVRNVENAKVQIPVKSNDQGKKEAILPKLEITSNHGSVTMPGGIKVTGDENWNGKIKMPTTVENISEFSGKNIMAISLGVDGKTLNFDQPVQIVLPGQAGKKIAFVTKVGDEPKKITHTLLATQNNPEAAGKAMKDAHVAEAKLDVDGDLVIWTTHFTTFVAYEESTSDGGAGGGTNTDKLEDGEYHVSALALYKKEDKASMTQQFIKDGATLHVKNGKITATMVWRKTQFINLPEVLETLEYKNSSGQFVNAIKSKNFGNGTVTVEFEVEDINKPIIFEVYAPKGMPGATPQFRMFLGTAAENISYSSNTLTIIGNGFYEADIKILKENEDEASIAESYFLKKADVEVKDDKNYVRLFIKNKEDIKDLTVEVDGNNVECETKIVKEYDNGKKANMVKFEIPKLDATIKLKAKIVPEDNKEVTFRVSLDRDQFKKKTDDSIEAYINLLEGKVIKAVDLSKNGLYEMTMEVKETDKSLLAMVQKYLVNEVHYEVIKGKNYVQVMLKNADEIKGLKVYVNSMSAKYEKIENNERNTVIRFEVPDAGAKIRFSICMSEEKEGYTGFDIALNQATAKELQEKIYLYIQSPEIVDVKKGSIQNIKLDVAPLIEENRTLVPLRGICETLGAKVKWQAATRSISLSDGEMKIELQVDQKSAKVNGKTIKMDVAPKIINERTFVPIRFISENLKHEVRWIKEEQKIVITKKLNMVEEKDTNKKENKEKIKSNKQKQLL
ncbi:MAG: NEAT domain-containing protein [Marinisporobacter sp.]|nr:NEAT domain-containing protein [Marinisporobacter sp.]